jgi:hypothetical protein
MKFCVATLAAVLSFSQVAAADQTPEQMQQLVAPIALYPDEMVAQVLAASTHPTEVVEADRWMQQHSNLNTDRLAQQVDKQPWDPSVRALTQFPSVLTNLDNNLSWTTALGDAYANQQQAVLDAVQVMRQKALSTGTLKTTPQQTVTTAGQTIVIEPTSPEVVYVPVYDPWEVYGPPLMVYPGWVPIGGAYIGRPGISFGIGFGVGFFGGFAWGWHHWGTDWHDRRVLYDHRGYEFHDRFHGGDIHREHGGFDHGREFHGRSVAGRPNFGGFHGGGHHR